VRLYKLAPLLLPAACSSDKDATTACSLDFAASVNSGPSSGTELAGTLRLDLASDGSLSGVLTQEDDSTIDVVGSADGYAINLAFALGEDATIFGVGTSDMPVAECTGTFGGPFTGPEEGDAGDWLARAFGLDSSTPSYNADY